MIFAFSKEIDELGWASETRAKDLVRAISQNFAGQKTPAVFVARVLWEKMNPNTNVDLMIDTLSQQNIQTVLLVNEAQRNDTWLKSIASKCPDVLFFDFFLYVTYRELIAKRIHESNASWNHRADKFLYLTGTARYERVRTFYKLYEAGLLDQMVWSLLVPDNKKIIDPAWIPELPPQEVYDFLKKYDKMADSAQSLSHPDGTKVCHSGFTYDRCLWQNSRFRLIAETDTVETTPWNPSYRITEKTWATVANRLPFLMLAKPKMLKTLRTKNFKTFEEYAKIPDYDSIKDTEHRIKALVENTQHWMSTGLPMDLVQKDIEYNYQLFVTLGQQIEKHLLGFIKKHNLSISLDELVPTRLNLEPSKDTI